MVQIGCVPQLTGLRRQRRYQFRMRMPQAVDRNPSAEIQKSPIVIAGQPTACARDKRHRRAIICGQNRRDHRNTFLMTWERENQNWDRGLGAQNTRGRPRCGGHISDVGVAMSIQSSFSYRYHTKDPRSWEVQISAAANPTKILTDSPVPTKPKPSPPHIYWRRKLPPKPSTGCHLKPPEHCNDRRR